MAVLRRTGTDRAAGLTVRDRPVPAGCALHGILVEARRWRDAGCVRTASAAFLGLTAHQANGVVVEVGGTPEGGRTVR